MQKTKSFLKSVRQVAKFRNLVLRVAISYSYATKIDSSDDWTSTLNLANSAFESDIKPSLKTMVIKWGLYIFGIKCFFLGVSQLCGVKLFSLPLSSWATALIMLGLGGLTLMGAHYGIQYNVIKEMPKLTELMTTVSSDKLRTSKKNNPTQFKRVEGEQPLKDRASKVSLDLTE